jgi:hypothetical protein
MASAMDEAVVIGTVHKQEEKEKSEMGCVAFV